MLCTCLRLNTRLACVGAALAAVHPVDDRVNRALVDGDTRH